jgi:Flp pilus assembly pilin Flp
MEDGMNKVWTGLRGLCLGGEERGQTMAEYGLILFLIALAVIGTMGLFGTALADYWDQITAQFTGL